MTGVLPERVILLACCSSGDGLKGSEDVRSNYRVLMLVAGFLGSSQPTVPFPRTWLRPPGIIRLYRRLRRTTTEHAHFLPSVSEWRPSSAEREDARRAAGCVGRCRFEKLKNIFSSTQLLKKSPTSYVCQIVFHLDTLNSNLFDTFTSFLFRRGSFFFLTAV